MKRLLFLFAFSVLLLASCNDDDENENLPGGGDPMQPTSGSITATINGESFSSTNNIARELSYGDFIIRSESEEKSLKFILNEFLGNATYTLTNQQDQNFVEYFVEINGESVGFESISGELVVTDYDEATNTFNADFNIVFARIGNPLVTLNGEGSYINLEIIEMEEPNSGEITVFYFEEEFYDYSGSATQLFNGKLRLELITSESDSIFTSAFAPDGSEGIGFPGVFPFISGAEVLQSTYNAETQSYTGHFKQLTGVDFEIWLKDIPVSEFEIDSVSDGVRFYTESDEFIFESDTLKSFQTDDLDYVYTFSTRSIENPMQGLLIQGNSQSSSELSSEPFFGFLSTDVASQVGLGTIRVTELPQPNRVNVKMTFAEEPFYFFVANNIAYEP